MAKIKKKIALIFGITGQDGSYLAELLLEKGYEVVGLKRRSSTSTLERISNIQDKIKIEEFEISDSGSVYSVVQRHRPDEIYNLAAQSHVKTSFDQPNYTFQVNTIGVTNFLEAIRRFSPDTKFYQASTSEMFGKSVTRKKNSVWGEEKWEAYQDENTVFEPQSPYAAAKLASHHLVRNYREGYGLFACCGILFNHESERRGENFVTRKITKWIAEFVRWSEIQGLDASPRHFEFIEDQIHSRRESFPKLRLGNVDAYRDWGHAQDYVYAMWLMLQQTNPDDYVIATGETHSVREFLDKAFQHIGIDNYEDFFVIDEKFYRPSEVEYLKGIPTKAEQNLGWERKVSFDDLVKRMVDSDIHAEEKKKQPQWQVRFVP